jgi:hypothetical protein
VKVVPLAIHPDQFVLAAEFWTLAATPCPAM